MTNPTHTPTPASVSASAFAHCFSGIDPQHKRQNHNNKWRRYAADVMPAWVAEHDFRPPDAVVEAMATTIERGDFGYNDLDEEVSHAFAGWARRRYGWSVDSGMVDPCVDALAGVTASVTGLSEPGEGVILTPPIYNVFLEICPTSRRRQLEWLMRRDHDRGWYLHPDDLETLVQQEPDARVLLWCNPHNPTGWVPDRAVMARIVELAHEYDFYVVSDEIHADVVYPPTSFTPMLSIPGAAERTVTITSPAKTFALSGLRCAVKAYGDPDLRERLRAAHPQLLLGHPARTGMDATIAAWAEGGGWVDELLIHLAGLRDQLQTRLAAEAPTVRFHPPQSTFLAWLDLSDCGLGDQPGARLLDDGRVAVQEGTIFGTNGQGHVRVNFGTSPALLDEIINRIISSINSYPSPQI